MLTKQDYDVLVDCMETRDRNGVEAYFIKDATPAHIQSFVRDIMYAMDGEITTLDLQYEIMASALSSMSDNIKYEQITGEDFEPMREDEHASVYTSTRLSYLNNRNDEEISDIMKEYSCENISTACAIWYDNTVNHVIDEMIDAIVKYEYENK